MMYHFDIPGTLPNLNDLIAANRYNRYKGASLKRKTQNGIIWCLDSQMKGIHIDKPIVAHFRWCEPNKRRDLDNIASAKKFIFDALVEYGTLKDDGWKQVQGFTDDFYIDKNNPHIEVDLEVI